MVDFISKLIAGILYLLIYAFFAYLTISAFQCDLPMIGAICFGITLGGIIYPIITHIDKKKEKRQVALQKMYNLPDVVRDEYGHTWDREFQQVISKAIEEATDNEKRADLLQC